MTKFENWYYRFGVLAATEGEPNISIANEILKEHDAHKVNNYLIRNLFYKVSIPKQYRFCIPFDDTFIVFRAKNSETAQSILRGFCRETSGEVLTGQSFFLEEEGLT